MFLIASAAYLGDEFQVEFGKLPPCMLPIGNKRLFEHQIEAIKQHHSDQDIYISLPDDYPTPPKDAKNLDQLNVNVIPVPTGLTLSESLLYVLNVIGKYEDYLCLLHGDTLIKNIPSVGNFIGISRTRDDYNWQVEDIKETNELVWCGCFGFTNIRALTKELVKSKGSFVAAIKQYANTNNANKIFIGNWLDCGHVNTYFKSRAAITTERAFNNLTFKEGWVIKSGPDEKIAAEREWFRSIPDNINIFTPKFLPSAKNLLQYSDERVDYALEYLRMSPLSELFVHAENPPFFWEKIFFLCRDFLTECETAGTLASGHEKSSNYIKSLLVDKTQSRLADYTSTNKISWKKSFRLNGATIGSLDTIVQHCFSYIDMSYVHLSITHGDFCFSNILFDSRGDHIKVIDPRGLNHEGQRSCYGDLRYDLAKLCHSAIGLYDFIMAGAYELELDGIYDIHFNIYSDQRIQAIQNVFYNNKLCGYDVRELIPLTILLFLSMLPLHNDDKIRQSALFANALRLYQKHLA